MFEHIEENKTSSTTSNINEPQKNDEEEKKKKKRLLLIICAIILVLLLLFGAGYGIYSAIKNIGNGNSETSITSLDKERDNIMTLIKRYVEKGEYERAMDLLESLLIISSGISKIFPDIVVKASSKLQVISS